MIVVEVWRNDDGTEWTMLMSGADPLGATVFVASFAAESWIEAGSAFEGIMNGAWWIVG